MREQPAAHFSSRAESRSEARLSSSFAQEAVLKPFDVFKPGDPVARLATKLQFSVALRAYADALASACEEAGMQMRALERNVDALFDMYPNLNVWLRYAHVVREHWEANPLFRVGDWHAHLVTMVEAVATPYATPIAALSGGAGKPPPCLYFNSGRGCRAKVEGQCANPHVCNVTGCGSKDHASVNHPP